MSGEERRHFVRIIIDDNHNLDIDIATDTNNSIRVFVKDISMSGIKINVSSESNQYIPENNEQLKISFYKKSDPERAFTVLSGIVRWKKLHPDECLLLGIEFIDVSREEREQILKIVDILL